MRETANQKAHDKDGHLKREGLHTLFEGCQV